MIRGLALDQKKRAILLLQDEGGRLLLPIWIGAPEANAIALALERKRSPRPLTHDLLKMIINALKAQVLKVELRGLKGGTYFADLYLQAQDETISRIDCRPSDAVALALRTGAPLWVASELLAVAQPLPERAQKQPPIFSADDEEGRQRMAKMLEEMDPKDFGEYEM